MVSKSLSYCLSAANGQRFQAAQLLVVFPHGIFCYFLFVAEHRADFVASSLGVAVNSVAVFGVNPAFRYKKAPAVFTFLYENVVFNHLDKFKPEQILDTINFIKLLNLPVRRPAVK